MANKKKINEQAKAWVVVGTNGIIETKPTLLSALKLAKGLKRETTEGYENDVEWYVFEITKSWLIIIGEPVVEEVETDFSELP